MEFQLVASPSHSNTFAPAVSHKPSSTYISSIYFPLHYTLFFVVHGTEHSYSRIYVFLPKVYHPFVFSYTQRSCLVDSAHQPRPERNELLEYFATDKRRICRTLNTSPTKNSMLDCALFSFWKSRHRKLDVLGSRYFDANSSG